MIIKIFQENVDLGILNPTLCRFMYYLGIVFYYHLWS